MEEFLPLNAFLLKKKKQTNLSCPYRSTSSLGSIPFFHEQWCYSGEHSCLPFLEMNRETSFREQKAKWYVYQSGNVYFSKSDLLY